MAFLTLRPITQLHTQIRTARIILGRYLAIVAVCMYAGQWNKQWCLPFVALCFSTCEGRSLDVFCFVISLSEASHACTQTSTGLNYQWVPWSLHAVWAAKVSSGSCRGARIQPEEVGLVWLSQCRYLASCLFVAVNFETPENDQQRPEKFARNWAIETFHTSRSRLSRTPLISISTSVLFTSARKTWAQRPNSDARNSIQHHCFETSVMGRRKPDARDPIRPRTNSFVFLLPPGLWANLAWHLPLSVCRWLCFTGAMGGCNEKVCDRFAKMQPRSATPIVVWLETSLSSVTTRSLATGDNSGVGQMGENCTTNEWGNDQFGDPLSKALGTPDARLYLSGGALMRRV